MWQRARARASAASSGSGRVGRLRRRCIMYCICFLVALPVPTTAFFTTLGLYSWMGMFCCAPASKTAALAMPSFRALCAFL